MTRYGRVWVRLVPGPAPDEVTWQATTDPALHFDWSADREHLTREYLRACYDSVQMERAVAEARAERAEFALDDWKHQHESRAAMGRRMARGERIAEQPVHWSWLHGPPVR